MKVCLVTGAESRASDPELIAATIRQAVESAKPRTRYAVGYLAKPVIMMRRPMTDRAFDRMVTRQPSH
ncbi:MAG: hypothetical protein GEV10_18365 [Streptosporangiales bacterium]|nr:hypothetical protein [Streptosporangiales bacterium]